MTKIKLSPFQQTFYVEWQLNPERSDYNITFEQDLSGSINPSRLDIALQNFVKDVVLFNSHIEESDEGLYWVANSFVKGLDYFDKPVAKDELLSYVAKPFDISTNSLYRVLLVKIKEQHYKILMVLHHLIIDGASVDYFINQLSNYYNNDNYHIDIALKQQTKLINADFIKLQKQIDYNLNQYKQFWQVKLKDVSRIDLSFLKLNTRKKIDSNANLNFNLGEFRFSFNQKVLKQTIKLKARCQITPYLFAQSIFAILLYRYTGVDKFGISYPIAIREANGFIHGAQVNTIVAPYDFNYIDNIFDVFTQIKAFIRSLKQGGINYSYCPVSMLLDASNNDLLKVGFIQTNLRDTKLTFTGIKEVKICNNFNIDFTNDLLFEQAIADEHIYFRVRYKKELIDENLLENFIEHYKLLYQDLLNKLLDDSEYTKLQMLSIKDIDILTEKEFNYLIYDLNATKKNYSLSKMIHQLFEDQVQKIPNNIALVYADRKLTYKELNDRSNQLAHYLRNQYQIKPDDLITLCLNRSEYMLIAILGVLKAGCAYVPIDPDYPIDRINYILIDTKTKVVLLSEQIAKNMVWNNYIQDNSNLAWQNSNLEGDQVTPALVVIDSKETLTKLAQEKICNIKTRVNINNLAYVIYTSGTTGKPKGVMLEHQGVVNRINWMNDEYPLMTNDCVLQKTPYVFDVSVWELLWSLWHGASVVFAKPDGHKDPDYLIECINQYKISIVHFVPSMLDEFNAALLSGRDSKVQDCRLSTLRYVFCSGEALKLNSVKETQKLLPQVEIHNLYGPTEASVDVLYYPCIAKDLDFIAIGKPISNMMAYVLDNHLHPLPLGAIGELYVGGIGLARGYLNLPELTNEKFILNPFVSSKFESVAKARNGKDGCMLSQIDTTNIIKQSLGSRLYKTGDLVRRLPNGNIEYIGRNDFQVKIRGFRIELGEIENALLKYSYSEALVKQSQVIKQSVVVAYEPKDIDGCPTGHKYLVAYYVANTKLDEEIILAYLSNHLPEYMLPSVLIYLEKLPLTINGKLDRKALPDPEVTNVDKYIAPKNELEYKICRIFAKVLNLAIDKIGMLDNFFRLGGNSIIAIKLATKLSKEFAINVNVAAIFKYPTIAKLIHYIEHNQEEKIVITKQVVVDPTLQSLSFAQERLWFIDQYEGGSNAYNTPMALKLEDHVNINIFEESIQQIVNRHEILRTLIKQNSDGLAYQVILDDTINPLVIPRKTVKSKKELTTLLDVEINHIYDLSKEYPIRACFYSLSKKLLERYISIVIHHIAFDGWSMDVFLSELVELYRHNEALSRNIPSQLKLSSQLIQYKDFALWQRTYLDGARLEKALDYWKNKLNEYETLNLKTDYERPQKISYMGDDIIFDLDLMLSQKLRELARKLNISLYSLLLSGFYLMLRGYANQDDIVVGTPMANRNYSQIEQLIGFFVNTIVLRVQIDPEDKLRNYIENIANVVAEAQLHQDLPFDKLVEVLDIAKDNSRNPIFQVMFGVQNFGNFVAEDSKVIADQTLQLYTHYPINNLYKVAKFDLMVMIDDSKEQLSGCFNYATSLFNKATIHGYISTYKVLLKQLVTLVSDKQKYWTLKIADLYYLNQDDYKKQLIACYKAESNYLSNKTITQLFEEQVVKTPNNIALVYANITLSYKELNAKANQLAHYLKQRYKIKPDDLIILCLSRSEYMLIAILGVLKAGGAYIPIDPNYPLDRISHILKDSKPKLIISNEIYQHSRFAHSKISLVMIDSKEIQDKLTQEKRANLINTIVLSNLAYVIYTSGTTGKPKGVMLEHASCVTRINYMRERSEITESDVVLFKTNYVFDVSFSDIFCGLLSGAKIYITKHSFDLDEIQTLLGNGITICHFVPSQFAEIRDTINFQEYNELTRIMFSGEGLNNSFTETLVRQGKTVLNYYGPTETGEVTSYKVTNSLDIKQQDGYLSIGQAFPGTTLYVLDGNLNLLPFGAIGELYIGGVSLARGYLNLPELTNARFIANPFMNLEHECLAELGVTNTHLESRLYKTGDLVRWLADGNLEYIGRNDFQVKIRGYRIELGEIEGILSKYPGVKQCVALALEHKNVNGNATGNKYLVGYYVAEHKLNETEISYYLSNHLSEYMVPDALVYLDKLPLTINGKLARNALPDPEVTNVDRYITPKNELEMTIIQVFAITLGIAVDKISMLDNFFRLGGNSLNAIKLASRLNTALNTSINVAAIFKHPIIQKLVHYIEHNQEEEVVIGKNIVTDVTLQALSFAQERLWFIEQYEGGSNAYNIPLLLKVSRGVDLDILEKSFKQIVMRHEILRTVIRQNSDSIAYQVVLDGNENLFNISRYKVKSKKELNSRFYQDTNHIYDLSNEFPLRVHIYELSKHKSHLTISEYYMSIVCHHIACDGWSMDIAIKELYELYRHYEALASDEPNKLNLPELSIQYKDYALWRKSYIVGERLNKLLNYWQVKLADYENLNLITDKVRPAKIDYNGEDVFFKLDSDISSKLKDLAKELHVSLYSVLLSGFYLMLRSYSNQDDLVIGTPMANRNYLQTENLIGFFVNSLPLRIIIDLEQKLKEYIQTVGHNVVEAQLHQELPFEKIVDSLNVAKDSSRHPIFQVMFGVQSFGSDVPQIHENVEGKVAYLFESYPGNSLYKVAKFDLTVMIDDSHKELSGVFNYATSLFAKTTIDSYIKTYTIILGQLAKLVDDRQAYEGLRIANIHYLNQADYKKQIITWNRTNKNYPIDKTIHELFEEQVKKTPNNIALVYKDKQLTYKELNERSNQLANYLRCQYKVKSDDLIALCLDRSEYVLIAILGVLKSGGAYVPIDPSYPDDRISYMLTDTQTKLILVNEINQCKLQVIIANSGRELQRELLIIDDLTIQNKLEQELTSTPKILANNNLAAVIYTSGTTGKPKGVMLEHNSLVNRFDWGLVTYPYVASDVCCFKTSLNFVDHLAEIFTPLLQGIKLIILGNSVLPMNFNLEKFIGNLSRHKVTRLVVVPALLEVMLDSELIDQLEGINYFFCSGDKLNHKLVTKFRTKLPNAILVNIYGSSEVSADATYIELSGIDFINQDSVDYTGVSIGHAISNVKTYVLDANLNPLPFGAIGELYIGGVGLARGYLNLAELTAEKFIANPFQSKADKEQAKNARLYKTGDLVRWLSDGNLEYMGRNDFQVKIRGYRIELGEIENALLAYSNSTDMQSKKQIRPIRQVVILARSHKDDQANVDENKYLVGYYVAAAKLDEAVINEYLSRKLPEYMVPSVLIYLEKLPLTVNGKLDRKVLPDPEVTNVDKYIAPRNELEYKVCIIFAKVLNIAIDKIGMLDNFFKLGGNSLNAIKLASQLSTALNISINVAAIFKHPIIQKLVQYIEHDQEEEIIIAKNIVADATLQVLSFAQERLWFIEQYEGGSNAYIIPVILKLTKGINLELLKFSIQQIVHRHEILRTIIKQDDIGNAYQVVLDDMLYPLKISEKFVKNKKELSCLLDVEINHVYDLSSEYPIQVSIYTLEKNMGIYLSLVVHHIAFDGWSLDILFNELVKLYQHYEVLASDEPSKLNLSELPMQYKDFALWQRGYLSGDRLKTELAYWQNKLTGYETLNLITDKIRPQKADYSGEDIGFSLDFDASQKLRELARELGVSLYSVLLSGFYLMLRSYANQDDIVIGTPFANRNYSQLENLIGFFVNSLALRVKIDPENRLKDYIARIGHDIVEAQLHQDLPFEKLVEVLNVAKDSSRHPIFQVMFGVQSFGSDAPQVCKDIEGKVGHLFELHSENSLYKVAKFDLTAMINDSHKGLRGVFNYATSLFTRTTIEGYIKTYTIILKQLSELMSDKEKYNTLRIADIHYLNQVDYKNQVIIWNQTEKEYPNTKTVHELFEEQVAKTPNNIALVYKDQQLTYKELNERSNQLAHYLRNQYQIKPDDLIALCLDRSEYMLIAILGILKAGCAYVPIDPSYPEDRISYILADIKTHVILTNKLYKIKLSQLVQQISKKIGILSELELIDSKNVELKLSKLPSNNLELVTSSRDLAYVIYTSGTTGKPKGVMLEHTALVNFVIYQRRFLNNNDIVLGYISYTFDAINEEIYPTLLSGAKLILVPESLRLEVNSLINLIIANSVTYLVLPALVAEMLMNMIDINKTKLRSIVIGGDVCKFTYFNPSIQLINHYGATEAAICSIANNKMLSNQSKIIGKPIDNTQAYVLDSNLNLLPTGAIGELYVGGAGLARGYLNLPDLTKQKFIFNPFQTAKDKQTKCNTRLYKTGDLVKYLQDGSLEFIGRTDFQVKVHGYRVELGEIEAKLASYPGIKQCVVLYQESKTNFTNALFDDESSNKCLIGYYLATTELKEDLLFNYLAKELPAYMVPNFLVHLDSFPITLNGKLDRKGLPDPEYSSINEYIAPRNELEDKVCIIFAEILGIVKDKVGIRDDFFQLGGNSILAIKLITRINYSYMSHLKIADLFANSSVEKILPRIVQTKECYQTIVKLNNTYNKLNLFMIHPGSAGAEVYTNLAIKMLNQFSCYGVDSYNLYNEHKILSLHELANYYLSYIDEIMERTGQRDYIFLGWSLGGQIALEMAAIIEARSSMKVCIYLLDTIIRDLYLAKLEAENIENVTNKLANILKLKNYEASYIDKVLLNLANDIRIGLQPISNKLNTTNIILFKAMLDRLAMSDIEEMINQYIQKLKYNNIDLIHSNQSKIKLIQLQNVSHDNILTAENELLKNINCPE